MLIIFGGIIAGLIHVFSGPDHLAAIAPLVLKQRDRAWLTGLRWGAGHASGVVVVGILSLLLRGILPVELISSWSDRLVGVLLIGIGLWAIRKALQIHTHTHDHHGEIHTHIHLHSRASKGLHEPTPKHVHTHAAFGIGTLHGLAGSSHFLAIIPMLAMPSNALCRCLSLGLRHRHRLGDDGFRQWHRIHGQSFRRRRSFASPHDVCLARRLPSWLVAAGCLVLAFKYAQTTSE